MRSLLALALLGVALGITNGREGQQVLSAYGSPRTKTKSAVATKPLGAADGDLADERFTASSYYRAPKSVFSPALGRLYAKPSNPSAGAWRPEIDSQDQWISVDLGREMKVTGVATQGQANGDAWVKSFRLQHSMDGFGWKAYPHEFKANTDSEKVASIDLPKAVLARHVRLIPTKWHRHIALRWEIYGYSPECGAAKDEALVGVPCAKAAEEAAAAAMGSEEGEANLGIEKVDRKGRKGFALGLGARLIPDSAFSASSVHQPKRFFANTDKEERCQRLHDALRAKESEAAKAEDDQSAASAPAPKAAPAAPAAPAAGAEDAGEKEAESFLALDERRLLTDAEADAEAEEEALVEAAMETETAAETDAETEAEAEGENAVAVAEPKQGQPPCGVKTSYAPHNARLGAHPQPYRSGGWRPAVDRAGEWLQLDLASLQEVDAVSTQGLAKSAARWVTKFDLYYSSNGRRWEKVPGPVALVAPNEGGEEVSNGGSFEGNADSSSVVKTTLPFPLLTRYLRFVVRDWNKKPAGSEAGGIGLRVEIHGPGKGSGCLLRCFAANLAKNSGGMDLDASLDAVNQANTAIFSQTSNSFTGVTSSKAGIKAGIKATEPSSSKDESSSSSSSKGEESSFLEVEGGARRASVASGMEMEMEAEGMALASVEILADLAVQADAQVSRLVDCCGCPCCDQIDKGACARKTRVKSRRPSSKGPSRSLSEEEPVEGGRILRGGNKKDE